MARRIGSCLALVCVLIPAWRTFAAETGMLYVKSDPPGATVVIDGKERGKTPVLVRDLAPGEVTVELRVAGAKPVTKRATVEARKVVNVDVSIEVPTATLTVISEPLEATLFLDQREVGKTPITLEKLAAGPHQLLLLRKDYPRTVRDIILQPGAEVTIDVKLGTAQQAQAPAAPPTGKAEVGREAPQKEKERPAADPLADLVSLLRAPGDRAAKAKAISEHLAKFPEGEHKAEVGALAKVFLAPSEDRTISAWADYAGAFPDGRLREEAIAALRRSGDALRIQMKLALAADDEERTAKLGRVYLAALPRNADTGEIGSLLDILETPRGAARSSLVKEHVRAYPQGTFTGAFEGSMAAWSAKEEGDAFERLKERFAATAPGSDLLRGVDLFLRKYGSGPHADEVRAARPALALDSARARLAAAAKYAESYPEGAFIEAVRRMEASLVGRLENDLWREVMEAAGSGKPYAGRLAAAEKYLKEYPEGEHAAEARRAAEEIGALIAEEGRAFEELSKSLEKIASTQEGLRLCEEFLRKHAGGSHAADAAARRNALRLRLGTEEEAAGFEALTRTLADASPSRIAKARECLRFLRQHPGGEHVPRVAERLKELASADLAPHAGPVRAAVFSPDSKLLVTIDAARGVPGSGVRVFSLPDGSLVQKYQSRPAFSCSSAVFSPGERPELWMGEASGCLSGWDLSRGEIAWRRRLGSAPVTSVAGGSGSRVATAFLGDPKVRTWDRSGWRVLSSLACPGGASAAAMSPADGAVAAGGRGGWVAVFGSGGGAAWTEARAHRGEVSCVAFSPSGLKVASCSRSDGTVAVWSAAAGVKAWQVGDVSAGVAFAGDSVVLTGAGLRAARDGELIAKLEGGGPVAASPGGVSAFTCDAKGTGRLWYLPALLWRQP